MAIKLPLSISHHKASRLILPCGLLIVGTVIFLCGLVRTYHVVGDLTKSIEEKRNLQAQNEYMEWWVGFLLILSAILAVVTVLLDKPILFRFSVLALGICLVLLFYALFLDAGEFSWLSRNMNYVRALKKDGFNCSTRTHKFNYSGHEYVFYECDCKRGSEEAFAVYNSCELLYAQYYLHAIMAFAIASAIALTLFTLSSFVLILKRISQITTALHLDEKPLSEDFNNVHGDLYVES